MQTHFLPVLSSDEIVTALDAQYLSLNGLSACPLIRLVYFISSVAEAASRG